MSLPELSNYIPDTNKFLLKPPPAWWLKKLAEFDISLVVIPSRQTCCYRLAQRRPLRLQENMVHEMLKEQADSAMMASYGLVPVTTIMSECNWDNPLMWNELAERAPWRQGGADAVNKRLDDFDAAKEAAAEAANEELTTSMAKDSWNLYRKKIGTGRTWHGAGISPEYS